MVPAGPRYLGTNLPCISRIDSEAIELAMVVLNMTTYSENASICSLYPI